jgi:hypothetical protein
MKSYRPAKVLAIVAGLVVAFAMFSPAAMAKKPNPGYEQFAGCPSNAENAAVVTCVRTDIVSGNFKMGNKNVPIENPLALTGGVPNGFGPLFFNSEGGLTKVKQKVPGGIIGLTGLTWLAEFLGSSALTLYATTELAGTPIILGLSGAKMPIKVHLENTTGVLGSNCYVGSTASPIVLNLTTGTTSPPAPNKPITGKNPTLTFEPAREILIGTGGTFVDNSFAAPGANGCVLTLFGFIPISINGIVNTASGLPSPAGTNETVQNFNVELVDDEFIY